MAWDGTIISVEDGDTVTVAPGGDRETPVSVRLFGIDAPERQQQGGEEAWAWLRNLLPVGQPVYIIPYDVDRYGRVVGLVQAQGRTINGDAVAAGHAWVYADYCKARFCRQWLKAQKEAEAHARGLWREQNPIPPWQWRRENRNHRESAS